MLLSAVSVLVVAQSSSEIPERLINNPVLLMEIILVLFIFLNVRTKIQISLKIISLLHTDNENRTNVYSYTRKSSINVKYMYLPHFCYQN